MLLNIFVKSGFGENQISLFWKGGISLFEKDELRVLLIVSDLYDSLKLLHFNILVLPL